MMSHFNLFDDIREKVEIRDIRVADDNEIVSTFSLNVLEWAKCVYNVIYEIRSLNFNV